jgi:hypothetical protein
MCYDGELPQIEGGRRVEVVFCGDLAVKTALDAGTADEAAVMAGRLEAYAEQLSQEPIAVAPLKEVDVIGAGDASRVRHSMGIIRGPSLLRLSGEDRQSAVAAILAGVCAMSEYDGPDSLAVPIDGAAKNWHMDGGTPTLVDVYPPLGREGGQLPLLETPASQRYWEYRYGTKSGAVSGILYSSLNLNAATESVRPMARVAHLLGRADSWCYDTLPVGMHPLVRRRVERQVRRHFIPLIARSVVRVATNRLSGMK